jgi:hypothetical protein
VFIVSARLLELANSTDAEEIVAALDGFIVHKNSPDTKDAYAALQAALLRLRLKLDHLPELEPEPETVVEPIEDDDDIVHLVGKRPLLPCDVRVSPGATVGQFLVWIRLKIVQLLVPDLLAML